MSDTYRILVVEDDEQIRDGIEIYLKSQGYEVSKAGDGIEGLEVLKKEKIHLAIVDVMMPRMDGIHMVMRLRKEYDFPVIMLSAKSEEVDKIMGLNMGQSHFSQWNFWQELILICAAMQDSCRWQMPGMRNRIRIFTPSVDWN